MTTTTITLIVRALGNDHVAHGIAAGARHNPAVHEATVAVTAGYSEVTLTIDGDAARAFEVATAIAATALPGVVTVVPVDLLAPTPSPADQAVVVAVRAFAYGVASTALAYAQADPAATEGVRAGMRARADHAEQRLTEVIGAGQGEAIAAGLDVEAAAANATMAAAMIPDPR